tara:strand:+ start:378 stop:533 length:156 start_codon:yes stop_codon:yes gene_type:complete
LKIGEAILKKLGIPIARMIMKYINCKDATAAANALNTLARAQTTKTSIPAE